MRRTLALLLCLLPWAVHADAVSAVQARNLLALGAQPWDVRADGTALLPGSVRADLARWRQGGGDVRALEQSVSAAGIDLSRDVVIYGAAGDGLAHALYEQLLPLATGRVHWLVGGVDEWQAAGLPTVAQAQVRLPVPQRLVPRADTGEAEPAAAMLRRGKTTPGLFTARL